MGDGLNTDEQILAYVRARSKAQLRNDVDTVIRYCAQQLNHQWCTRQLSDEIKDEIEPSAGTLVTATQNNGDRGVVLCHDKSWEPGNERAGAKDLQKTVHANPDALANIVITHIDKLTQSQADLDAVITFIDEHNKNLHIVDQGVVIRQNCEHTEEILRSLSTLSGPDSPVDSGNLPLEKHSGGRPPLGFTSEDGDLQPGENYEEVREVLQAVRDNRLSVYKAADRLDCVRQTIRGAREKKGLYQLE